MVCGRARLKGTGCRRRVRNDLSYSNGRVKEKREYQP